MVAAEAYHVPAAVNTPATLIERTSQFNSVADGGDQQSFTEQLTNVGSSGENVKLSSRALGAYSTIKTATVTLSDTASPESVDYQGYTDNYQTVRFYVPRGVDRLNGSIAFQAASSSLASRVRLALVTPTGQLADYSLPQGIGNYGTAQVAEPVSGWWTAYIWSRNSAVGGTTGPVLFGASVANFQDFGHVSPTSLYIPAGATRSVTLTVRTPSKPGDSAGSLVVSSPDQAALAIPVTLRSLVPSGTTKFSGVLTGGNGREIVTGVTQYYQVRVPAGSAALNGSVTFADNPNNGLFVWLVDPSGQAQSYQSNQLIEAGPNGLSLNGQLGANVHVVNPAAGLWTLIIDFAPTVSGTALSEPFSVSLNDNAPQVSVQGLHDGQSISATNGTTVYVKIRNNGTTPEQYFIDGRLNSSTQYSLPSQSSSSTTVPLNYYQPFPVYLVPSQTTSLAATASTSGGEPIQFDLGGPSGDPDIGSGQGTSVSAGLSGNPVSAGLWDIAPTTVGPFSSTPAVAESVDTSLTATTQTFDFSVNSPETGDLWQAAIGGPITVSSVVVQPGQTASIPVQILPTGTPGSRVSGVLYLDDESLWYYGEGLAPNGNTVAAIPYSYRISK